MAIPTDQINGSQARLMLTRLLPKGSMVRIRDCSADFFADLSSDDLPVPAADFESGLVGLVVNQSHVVRLLREFAAYYNRDRPHEVWICIRTDRNGSGFGVEGLPLHLPEIRIS